MPILIGLVRLIDRINDAVGRGVSWLTVAMVLIVFTVVVLRYVFSIGWIAMQEIYVWIHGTVFMLGAAYTLLHDGHVRIDLIYRDASQRYKSLVNLLGSLFLVLPVLWITWDKGLPFVMRSWRRLESSSEVGGGGAARTLSAQDDCSGLLRAVRAPSNFTRASKHRRTLWPRYSSCRRGR